MATRRFLWSAPSDGSSVGTSYSPYFSGYIEAIEYVKDGTTPYTDGVDFTITSEATGETIWTETNVNAAVIKHPRQATHSTAGVAALYAAGGQAVNDHIALGRDRVKVVLAAAGASKLGAFRLTIRE
jgi:hypothetical protein